MEVSRRDWVVELITTWKQQSLTADVRRARKARLMLRSWVGRKANGYSVEK